MKGWIYTMMETLISPKTCAKLPSVLTSLGNKIYVTSIKELTNGFMKHVAFIIDDFFLALDAVRCKEYDRS